ncbi:MAG: hypothetical protein PHV90_07150 [Smithella sp.]|nr:hypothetical protein [Smithella sp.]
MDARWWWYSTMPVGIMHEPCAVDGSANIVVSCGWISCHPTVPT